MHEDPLKLIQNSTLGLQAQTECGKRNPGCELHVDYTMAAVPQI
jgi:hypothetical protein